MPLGYDVILMHIAQMMEFQPAAIWDSEEYIAE